MSALMEQIEKLSREERLALAEEIFQGLAAEGDWPFSAEQEAEIDREIENFARDGNPGDSWDAVRARIVAGTTNTAAR